MRITEHLAAYHDVISKSSGQNRTAADPLGSGVQTLIPMHFFRVKPWCMLILKPGIG
jgi:hypothetical protein